MRHPVCLMSPIVELATHRPGKSRARSLGPEYSNAAYLPRIVFHDRFGTGPSIRGGARVPYFAPRARDGGPICGSLALTVCLLVVVKRRFRIFPRLPHMAEFE